MRRDNFLAVAKQIEQRFHLMCKLRDGVEAEHAARPFDGMRRPKDFVQQIHIFGVLFKCQQPFLDDGEMLRRFLKKGILKLREIVAHSRPRRS